MGTKFSDKSSVGGSAKLVVCDGSVRNTRILSGTPLTKGCTASMPSTMKTPVAPPAICHLALG